MADIVDKKTRSRMMSGISGKNTKPEMLIRKSLFARGYRYRIHNKKLPGKPDIVLRRFKTAILIHGCFWHGHENCHLFRPPKSRTEFWSNKILGNQIRDAIKEKQLIEEGWRVLVIWECALKGRRKIDFDALINQIESFLSDPTSCHLVIRGNHQDKSGATIQ